MDISCRQLLAEYYAAKETVRELVRVPLALVSSAEALINKGVSSAEDLISSAVGLVNSSIFDISTNDLLSSLYGLLDCVEIASSALAPTILSGIDAIENELALPGDVTDMLKSQAERSLSDTVKSVASSPQGKLADLDATYASILNNSGTTAALSTLQGIEQCLEQLCGTYNDDDFSYTKLKEKLALTVENKASTVYDTVKSVPEDVKTRAKAISSSYVSLKNSVASKNFNVI